MEADERKREREVKLTDKLPPAKRTRTCKRYPVCFCTTNTPSGGTPSQPKSLFQKTKSEASKLRRSIYPTRFPPQIPHGKALRPTTAPLATPLTKSWVTIKTESDTRPSNLTPQTTPPRPVQSTNATDPVSKKDLSPPRLTSSAHLPQSQPPEPGPSKPPIQKRDPMASLFMPKHRALSQLPSQTGNKNRSVPAR